MMAQQGMRSYEMTEIVRRGLDALIARPVWYELAAIGIDEGGVWSSGAFFPIGGSA